MMEALLFITPGCPHCPAVLQALSEMVKEGIIGKLTAVNAAMHPELVEEYGVRSAPWIKIGPYTFTGTMSAKELRYWAEDMENKAAQYVEHLLQQGGYRQAAAFIAEDTQRLKPLLGIIANPAANLEVRLGASALLESYAGKAALRELLPQLAELSRHADYRVRADACHLLGLTGSQAARTHVELCLRDANQEVREIAEEALAELESANTHDPSI